MSAKTIEWGGKIAGERAKDAGASYGKVRRRLYKKQRRPARLSAAGLQPPLELPDARPEEVANALASFCEQLGTAGAKVGDCPDYDPLRDEYTCVAKILDGGVGPDGIATGAVKDVKVGGVIVAIMISFFRQKRAHQEMVKRRAGRVALVR